MSEDVKNSTDELDLQAPTPQSPDTGWLAAVARFFIDPIITQLILKLRFLAGITTFMTLRFTSL